MLALIILLNQYMQTSLINIGILIIVSIICYCIELIIPKDDMILEFLSTIKNKINIFAGKD